MNRLFSILTFLFLIVCGAASQSNDIYLQFVHTANTQPLVINETVFPIWNGKMIKLTRAEFYLSKFELTDKEGLVIAYPENYMLINGNGSQDKILLGKSPGLDLDALSFYIGVDKDKNHLDPTLYPATSALSLKEPSMHWGWAGGYRFMAIEGLVDLDGDGKPETEFQYHNLGDELYKKTNVVIDTDESGDEVNVKILVDYAKLFENLTMVGNNIVHGSSAKNNTMLTNAANAGFFSQLKLSNIEESFLTNEDLRWSIVESTLNLQFSEKCLDDTQFSIVDINGRIMHQSAITSRNANIQLTSLPSSLVYIVLSKDNIPQLVKPILIQY